jgi:hypothetical protein
MRVSHEVSGSIKLFDAVKHRRCFCHTANSLLKIEVQGRIAVLFVRFNPDTFHLYEIVISFTKK